MPIPPLIGPLVTAAGAGAQPAPEKASPFTAVRWDGDQPIVRVEGDWYEFAGVDDLTREGFNPNTNGRRVYENLGPGRYDFEIVGSGRFAGFERRAEGIEIGPDQAPLTPIEPDR